MDGDPGPGGLRAGEVDRSVPGDLGGRAGPADPGDPCARLAGCARGRVPGDRGDPCDPDGRPGRRPPDVRRGGRAAGCGSRDPRGPGDRDDRDDRDDRPAPHEACLGAEAEWWSLPALPREYRKDDQHPGGRGDGGGGGGEWRGSCELDRDEARGQVETGRHPRKSRADEVFVGVAGVPRQALIRSFRTGGAESERGGR